MFQHAFHRRSFFSRRSAIALDEFGDVVLALPFPVDALVTLGLPLVVVIRDLVLALLRYGAIGLLQRSSGVCAARCRH